MISIYGYKHQRGPGPGCQPKDLVNCNYNETDKYYGTVTYDRELTEEEEFQFDLEKINY